MISSLNSESARSLAHVSRHGTIHIVVLLAALIVAAIGLGSLQLLRLQARTSAGDQDFAAARFHARTALELGLLKIRNDPYWRRNLRNGDWLNGVTIGEGTIQLTAADPIDNDIVNGENHPVILTGTGRQGDARFSTSVRLEVGPPKGSCFEVSMTSGDDLSISSATIAGDQTISANGDLTAANGAMVNTDVESFGGITGSTYAKTRTTLSAARQLPNAATALSYYLANGTTISYSVLPSWPQSEVLSNTTFESNTNGWSAPTGGTLSRSSVTRMSGSWSLWLRNRTANTQVVMQNLPFNRLRSGDTYLLKLPIRSDACSAQAVLTVNSTGEGAQTFVTPLQSISANTWTTLTGNITPTWTGTLNEITVSVSLSTVADFYLDDVSLTNVTYPSGFYVLDGLLSPTINPYGSTNSQGIYVINCSGRNVLIGRSRIVGTVVFINPGDLTSVLGPTSWEPAVYNYPAILSDNTINIATSSVGFSEAAFGANLNPPGTPYPYNGGNSNTTYTETFPDKITGLIYSANDLRFYYSPTIFGSVIASDDISINSGPVTINYNHVYLNDAPPGFDSAGVAMKIVPGTWRRQVD